MPDSTEEELARLRARAYGPDADLDREGLARLAELEAALSPRRAPAEEPDQATVPEGGEGPDVPHPHAPVEESLAADGAEPPALVAPISLTPEPVPRTLDRGLRGAWIVSLVVTAALAAGVTAWTLPWGVRDDQQHAARLTLQSADVPAMSQWDIPGLDQDALRSYGSYSGLQVYATESCIIVSATRPDAGGSSSGTCAGGGLDPSLDFYVTRTSAAGAGVMGYPDELRTRFPDGGVVRFTRHGEIIVVDEGELPPGL